MSPHTSRSALRRTLRRPLVWARHRGVGATDVILGSYPRSGGTWLAIMLAEYFTGTTFDLHSGDNAVPMIGSGKAAVSLADAGRLLRTHEPYRREYRRSILLVRDPRDIAVSYFHFQHDRMGQFDGSITEFVERFVDGTIDNYSAWHHHVASWLNAGDAQIVVRYEDLRDAPGEQLRRMIEFLGGSASTDAITAVVESNSLTQMQAKEDRSIEAPAPGTPLAARFVRAGAVGGWRDSLDLTSATLIDNAMAETMARVGYQPTTA